jgi:hypothetical protein
MAPRPLLRGKQAMVLTAFRLPEELLERIDRYAAQLTTQTGIPVQRAESARQLLEAGLRIKAQGTARKRQTRRGSR